MLSGRCWESTVEDSGSYQEDQCVVSVRADEGIDADRIFHDDCNSNLSPGEGCCYGSIFRVDSITCVAVPDTWNSGNVPDVCICREVR